MSTWTINPSESDAYRERHGSSSLLLHFGPGGFFVCKRHDEATADLVALNTHAETTVSAEKFKAEFKPCFMDEALFYLGSPEVKESAQRQLNAQTAAEKFCIEQNCLARQPGQVNHWKEPMSIVEKADELERRHPEWTPERCLGQAAMLVRAQQSAQLHQERKEST